MTTEIPIREITMFSQLPDEALEEVAAAIKTRELAEGEILFNLGDPGDELIIVKEGKVAIYSPTEDAPAEGQAIRIFQAGEMLGEMALIDQKPRSLSARAEEATTIMTLSGTDFQELLAENFQMVTSVMGGLNDRIRYTTDFLGQVSNWVQKMAQGDYEATKIDESEFEDQTLASLAAEFAKMATEVKEREEALREEVKMLRIKIDQNKRKQDVAEIMESDYYKGLKDKLKGLRDE